jgi:hypothetical protein
MHLQTTTACTEEQPNASVSTQSDASDEEQLLKSTEELQGGPVYQRLKNYCLEAKKSWLKMSEAGLTSWL